MDKKISLPLFLICQLVFGQDTKIGYINSGAISQGKNCGVGEIFVIPEVMQRPVDSSLNEEISNEEIIDSKSNLITIYPNPVHDYLYIKTSSSDQIVIRIMTIDGKEVGSYLISTKSSINVNSLSAGVYLILFSDKQFEPIKFIKK